VQARAGEFLADVVAADPAGHAFVAMLAGVRCDHVAHADVGDALAHFHNGSREFMTENDGALMAGQRMRCIGRNEDGAGDVFMQIRTADAAPFHFDLDPTGFRGRRNRNGFDADILFSMPDGGTHCFAHVDTPSMGNPLCMIALYREVLKRQMASAVRTAGQPGRAASGRMRDAVISSFGNGPFSLRTSVRMPFEEGILASTMPKTVCRFPMALVVFGGRSTPCRWPSWRAFGARVAAVLLIRQL